MRRVSMSLRPSTSNLFSAVCFLTRSVIVGSLLAVVPYLRSRDEIKWRI